MKSVLLAPTGRAAKVLASFAGKQAFTIHKKIYRQKSMKEGIGSFSLDRNLSRDTFFIVDEASMISNSSSDISIFGSGKLLEDLIEYVYSGTDCKLILVGDTAQLPPVGSILSPALDPDALKRAITPATRLVAISHASNVIGVVSPLLEIAEICHDKGVLLLVDGAQSVPHMPIDVNRLGCDFFAFSGHKMLGPTGTGVLWMKEPLLEPVMFGGGMVETVTDTGFVTAEGYQKYEAGTPNIGGGIGLGVAADYLQRIGMERIQRYEETLTNRLITGLEKIEYVHCRILTPVVCTAFNAQPQAPAWSR
jgi:hypothetical protein